MSGSPGSGRRPRAAGAAGQPAGPLALIEVGASAGLCLLPNRYASDDAGTIVGDPAAPPRLAGQPDGPVPIPTALPEVIWRPGIDLAPVDLADPDAVRWLECCIWPDQPRRLARLPAAIGLARADPPRFVAGDLLEEVCPVVAQAPADATVVVVHAATLVYLPRRAADGSPSRWPSCRRPGAGPKDQESSCSHPSTCLPPLNPTRPHSARPGIRPAGRAGRPTRRLAAMAQLTT